MIGSGYATKSEAPGSGIRIVQHERPSRASPKSSLSRARVVGTTFTPFCDMPLGHTHRRKVRGRRRAKLPSSASACPAGRPQPRTPETRTSTCARLDSRCLCAPRVIIRAALPLCASPRPRAIEKSQANTTRAHVLKRCCSRSSSGTHTSGGRSSMNRIASATRVAGG